MGRRITLNKAVRKQLVEILEAGNFQKTAYESLGIPEATYFHWLKEGEKAESKEGELTEKEEICLEFLESIKRAVQKARQVNLAVIRKAAENGSWQAAAWFLERTDFDEFGNKSKLEHTGSDGKPMVFKVIYD